MAETELAIIGAGPAGLAAAVTAARAGVQVTLLDEYPTPGGQYRRSGHDDFQSLADFSGLQASIDWRPGTMVWALSDGWRLAINGPQGAAWLDAQMVIVASGARELVLPLPGWTLPGVMTAGAALGLAKTQRLPPGQRVLVAGCGPLLLPCAAALAELGTQVVAVLEASRPYHWLRHAPALWGNWDRLGEGWRYWRALRRAGIPYCFGHSVAGIEGNGQVERARVVRLDGRGRPRPSGQLEIRVDAVCLSFGFRPNLELTQLAGCEHVFDAACGGWVPRLNETLETSRPGLFVAGEAGGVRGAAAAQLDGELAGLAAALRLGRVQPEAVNAYLRRTANRRRQLARFGEMLNQLFGPKPGLHALIPDEAVLCRCEEVTVGEARALLRQEVRPLDALKLSTRLAHGYCQGRTCGPLTALLASELGGSQAEVGWFNVRPPLKPVALAALASLPTQPAPQGAARQASAPVLPETRSGHGAMRRVQADVVIIGGGIVGAACAYYLSSAGLRVQLLERRFVGAGTSRACDGLILLWDKLSPAELALGQASARLWAELAETLETGFEYARRGTLWLAEDEAGMATGRAKAEAMQAARVRAEVLDSAGLHALEPNLAPDLPGGVFFPDDAKLDARRATLALLAAAQRRGAVVQPGAEVRAFQRDAAGRVTGVQTQAEEISAGAVVCAAGVWSNSIAEMLGIRLPVRPRKGHILVTARRPGVIRHPMLEGAYSATVASADGDLQVAMVADITAADTLLLGSSRQFAGYDLSASPAVMQALAARAVRFLPCLAGVSVVRCYTGLRPWSPDHLPLIGPLPAAPGFYLATGHEGAGIGLAPVTGQLIADMITGKSLPDYATEVRPGRFDL